MKTKIITLTILIYFMILASCQNRRKENESVVHSKNDTEKIDKHASAGTQSNEIKSEAPDALTKTEQGYALPKFDDGPAQSPINILSSYTEKDNHKIEIRSHGEINAVENLGHTIQLDFADESTTTVDGRIYKFKQLHFHTPSEHLVDGMTFPMEMHMVNVSKDQKDSTKSVFTVIAILFKMGKENKFIKEFLNSIPANEDEKVNLQPGLVKLDDLFIGIPKNDLEPYYHYNGSLTTPPYTESVDWIVRKYIFEASPEQVAAIEKLEGDNARHVRALYDRKVASE